MLSKLAMDTIAGTLWLRNVPCYVHTLETIKLAISMSIMRALDHFTGDFLLRAVDTSDEYDLTHLQAEGIIQRALFLVPSDDDMDTDDENDSLGSGSDGDFIPYVEEVCQIQSILAAKVEAAISAGTSEAGVTRLKSILNSFVEMFRL